MAEMAIRRLSKRLDYLEEIMSAARIAPPDGGPYGEPAAERDARLKRVQAEIALIEGRLRELLQEDQP